MSRKEFAYGRVSDKGQNEGRQMVEFKKLGLDERDVFIDKQSGKNFDRDGYLALKRCLREGDLLYIASLDRLGRNSKEIKREWDEITQVIKADIKVLDMPLLDTTQYKDTLGTFVSELVLQVLAFVAQKEREDILKRQRQGIDLAKAENRHLGRPKFDLSCLTKDQMETLVVTYPKWKNNEITAVKFMDELELKRSTFYKIIKEYESKKESA
jgi:DNA invertase Pin-like site-specific DNA recombinase